MAKKRFKKRKGRVSTLTQEGREFLSMRMKINQSFPDKKDALAYVRALMQEIEFSEQTTEVIP